MRWLVTVALCLVAVPVGAQTQGGDQSLLPSFAAQVSPARQRATIEQLVSFGTRHTMSDTKSDIHGIGAARRWVQSEFDAISQACGGCLSVVTPSDTFTNPRAMPTPTKVVDVLGIQRGTTDPTRFIVISAHLDTRVRDPSDFKSDAPGADDDGSGVAAVLEAARILSTHRFPATLVYAVTSGEEEGLFGGRILAAYAKAQGWRVEADLNNDIIGNTEGTNGARDSRHVRVFSEGPRSGVPPTETPFGPLTLGEVDSPSRNLARFIDRIADNYLDDLGVTMIYRLDRLRRAGDQWPMIAAGFPAVRFTEAVENYHREHQDVRVENGLHYGDTIDGIDFPYLARVTRLNILTMAALALAPAPPGDVSLAGDVSADTTVSWRPVEGALGYRVWWRATTDPQWRYSRTVGDVSSLKLDGVVIDDWFFGVSSISANGYESPVEFPGPQGAFFPETASASVQGKDPSK